MLGLRSLFGQDSFVLCATLSSLFGLSPLGLFGANLRFDLSANPGFEFGALTSFGFGLSPRFLFRLQSCLFCGPMAGFFFGA